MVGRVAAYKPVSGYILLVFKSTSKKQNVEKNNDDAIIYIYDIIYYMR